MAVAPAAHAQKATATPVKIGIVSNEGDAVAGLAVARQGAQAAAKYANDELGGIAGHPIQTVLCVTSNTPTTSQSCANRLVEQGVSAVVLGSDANTDVIVPILKGAGVPYIAAAGIAAAENTTDGAFALTGGLSSNLVSLSQYAKDRGYKKIAVVALSVPSVVALLNTVFVKAMSKQKIVVTLSLIPLTAADVTPQMVNAARADADALVMIGTGPNCISAMRAYETLGMKLPILMPSNICVSAAIEKAAPRSAYVGTVFGATQYLTSGDKESDLYLRVMKRYASSVDTTSLAQRGYVAMLSLVRATQAIKGAVTPAAVTAAMKAAKDVPLPLGGGSTFTCDGKQLKGQISVCSAKTLFISIKGSNTFKLMSTIDPGPLFARL